MTRSHFRVVSGAGEMRVVGVMLAFWATLVFPGLPGTASGQVCISELMYRPASENVKEEFIELHNPGTRPVNLEGWRFTTGVRFTFPSVQIAPGGFLTVAADMATFRSLHPTVTNVVGDWDGILSNSGQLVELADASGSRVDAVRYADAGDWSERVLDQADHGHRGLDWHSAADGGGASLELRNSSLPNDHGQNWGPSVVTNGTPGQSNSIATSDLAPMILEPRHFPPLPRSIDSVTITARIVDELTTGLDVRLYYRADSATKFSTEQMLDDGVHGDGAAGDGIFGASVPAQPDNTVVEFYFTAADAGGNRRTYPAPVLADGTPDQRANFLYQVCDSVQAGGLPEYRLILKTTDLQELSQINKNTPAAPYPTSDQTRSHAEFNGTFVCIDGGGVAIHHLVDVRNRGNGSRNKQPQSFRINFRSDDLWKSVAAINLNSQYTPAQLLGSALYRRAGLPAQSSRPVRLRVNGVSVAPSGPPSYGFHVANEVLNSEFAAHVFPRDSSGNLYRGIRLTGNGADLHYEGEDPAPYRLNYFKQSNTSQDDWSDLIELTRVLDGEPDQTYASAVQRVIDVEEWMLYFALETLVDNRETNLGNGNNGDGKGDDYFLYSGKEDPRFRVVPYDLDTILNVGDLRGNVADGLFRMNANPRIERFMQHPDFAPIYYSTLRRLAQTVFSADTFDALVDQTLRGLAPDNIITGVKSFAAARRDFVLSQIPQIITITNLPPLTNGYSWTSTSTLDLAGFAPACETRAINVNGQPVQWTAWNASWTVSGLPLNPGLNRILVQAFNSNGDETGRQRFAVWRDSGATAPVGGQIAGDATWTAAAGPYLVTGSLVIAKDATLTILPGTTVCFEVNGELVVNDGGRLVAAGIEMNPVAFVLQPGAAGRWKGITINGSTGSPETRLSHVHIEGNGSTAIHSVGGTVFLDHLTFSTTDRQYVSLDNSSFVVQDCEFPTGTAAFELVHGSGGIKSGGRGLFRRNFFGSTTGYSDVIDFTGGNRPADRIVEFINNVFVGASDDHLDLDGTDAWVEGNIFLHAHKNGSPDTASAVSGGSDGGRTSEVTVVRNIFFDCDHAAMAKQGNFYVLLNNTIVHQSHAGGLDTDGGVICLADEGTAEGAGMYLEGNIVNDTEKLVRNRTAARVTFNHNMLPTDWTGPGTDNIVSDPMFVHVPEMAETQFKSWAEAQIMRAWLSLRTGSPAHAVLAGGRDLGAMVPTGVFVSGEPRSRTAETTAVLSVWLNVASDGVPAAGWPGGAGYTHYRWRLDEGPWSESTLISEPIVLHDLAPGPHQVQISGRSDSGLEQDDPAIFEDAAITSSRQWHVDPGYVAPPQRGVRFNEILAANRSFSRGGSTPDLVELYNDSDAEIDLGGVGITTDPNKPYAFVFPPHTLIPARGYVVLAGGDQGTGVDLQLGFSLRQNGESLSMFEAPAKGGALLDAVSWGLQVPDLSIGVLPDGTWGLTQPTFGGQNSRQPLADAGGLKINEWLAATGVLFRDGFAELFNGGSLPVDLSGLYLSDSPVCPVVGQRAPPGTLLSSLSFVAGKGLVRFLADGRQDAGGDHLSFRLNAEDGAISLLELGPDASVARVIDCVMYGPQLPDVSQGRSPDGGPEFALFAAPSPGSANPDSGVTTNLTTLVFPLISLTNSWRYWQNGDAGTAWREEAFDDRQWPAAEAPFGRDPDPTAIPLRTPLAIGKIAYYFRTAFVFPTNAAGMRLQLQTCIDDGAVLWLNGQILARVNLTAADPLYSTRADSTVDDAALVGPTDIGPGSLREGTNTLAIEVHQSSSTSSDVIFALRLDAALTITNVVERSLPVLLNEILASNASLTNTAGRTPDYVELVNTAAHEADLAGCTLTDDLTNPRRYVFPPGSSIPPNGFLLLECDDAVPASGTNTGFDLSANGGALFLLGPAGSVTPVDFVHFGVQVPDFSIGRSGPADGKWLLNLPTPGAPNVAASTGNPFLLRINEWMAVPASGDDWFELYNPGQDPVAIGDLFLTDNFADRTQHQIQPLSFIGTGRHAFLKFVADGNQSRGANHVGFKLDADGEAIGLFTELGMAIDAVAFGAQAPGVSEGRFPDGSNAVLRFPQTASPAAPNHLPPEPDSDGDGLPDAWELANELNPINGADAAVDSDGDGLTNLQEYLAGTRPQDAGSTLRFTEAAVADGILRLRFTGAAGRAYQVQVLDWVQNRIWAGFVDVPLLTQDSIVEVTDRATQSPGLRFYRLIVAPAP